MPRVYAYIMEPVVVYVERIAENVLLGFSDATSLLVWGGLMRKLMM